MCPIIVAYTCQGAVEVVLREAGLGKYVDLHPQLVHTSLQAMAYSISPQLHDSNKSASEDPLSDDKVEECENEIETCVSNATSHNKTHEYVKDINAANSHNNLPLFFKQNLKEQSGDEPSCTSINNCLLKEELITVKFNETCIKYNNFQPVHVVSSNDNLNKPNSDTLSKEAGSFLDECAEDHEQRLKVRALMEDQPFERSVRSIRRAIQREQENNEITLLKPKRRRNKTTDEEEYELNQDIEDEEEQLNFIIKRQRINKTARLRLNTAAVEKLIGVLIKKLIELNDESEELSHDASQMVGACLQVVLGDEGGHISENHNDANSLVNTAPHSEKIKLSKKCGSQATIAVQNNELLLSTQEKYNV